MKEDYRLLVLRSEGGIHRYEDYKGKRYLVAPVTMLVEGVIRAVNSPKPEFVGAERFSVSPTGWNGRPLFIDHPMVDGKPVSGNSPDVLRTSIGYVFNAKAQNRALKAEVWIDEEVARMQEQGAELCDRVLKNRPVEISVGAHVTLRKATGTYNGKEWTGAWDQIIPDHLALLSKGDTGACSCDMGCGIRAAVHPVGKNDAITYSEELLKIFGGPGSGNFNHEGIPGQRGGSGGGGGAADAHTAAAGAHLAAGRAHEVAAANQGMGKSQANAMTKDAAAATAKASAATKATNAKPYAAQAARAYTKMAKEGNTMKPVEAHREAARYHYAAASIHETAAGWSKRNAKEGDLSTARITLAERVKGLLAKLRVSSLEDDPDGDEAAEVISYETIRAVLGNACEMLQSTDETLDELLAIEQDASKKLPEEAEEAVERAHLGSMQSKLMGAMGDISSALRLVQDLIYASEQEAREDEQDQKVVVVGNGAPYTLRSAAGAEFSKKNKETIQKVHDHTISMGAVCDPEMRSASAGANPCSCGNHNSGFEETGGSMTREARIAKLLACDCNPFKEKAQLEALQDDGLTAVEKVIDLTGKLRTAATKADTEKVVKDLAEAHSGLMAHATNLKAKEKKDEEKDGEEMKAAVRAAVEAAMPKTEEEFLKIAPESIRTLVSDKKAEDEATIKTLVAALKTAQKEYSEEELKKMDAKSLQRIARLAGIGVEKVDFSGRGGPRVLQAGESDYMTQAPPDGYRAALDKKNGKEKVQ